MTCKQEESKKNGALRTPRIEIPETPTKSVKGCGRIQRDSSRLTIGCQPRKVKMRTNNFNEIIEKAMNSAAETSRDKGLLENALTMTSFSMPSQADVIDYEITLLTEKQNQIYQHIEELASEAAERLTEMQAERAEIMAKMAHYQREYSEALRRKQYSARVYGRESLQTEKYAAAFVFACDLYTKAESQLHAIDNEIAELTTLAANTRAWLTGNAPSVVQAETSDDLPFESAKAETAEEIFDRLVKTHTAEVIDYVVRHRDIRAQDDSEEIQAVIQEITAGRVSAEDVLQSLDEVLAPEYADFFEGLNAAYATDPKAWQRELAECVEAYAA